MKILFENALQLSFVKIIENMAIFFKMADLIFRSLYFRQFVVEIGKINEINRKFRVPRKQGAHFLGERAQIQDPWVFSSSA
jgi:hypothetical protein